MEIGYEKMKKSNIRKVFLMITDVILVILSSLVTNAVLQLIEMTRYDNTVELAVKPIRITGRTAMNVLFCYFMLFVTGAYNKVWRSMIAKDYLMCAVAVTSGLGLAALFALYMDRYETVAFFIINILVTNGAVTLFRVIFRHTFMDIERLSRDDGRERTLIVARDRKRAV